MSPDYFYQVIETFAPFKTVSGSHSWHRLNFEVDKPQTFEAEDSICACSGCAATVRTACKGTHHGEPVRTHTLKLVGQRESRAPATRVASDVQQQEPAVTLEEEEEEEEAAAAREAALLEAETMALETAEELREGVLRELRASRRRDKLAAFTVGDEEYQLLLLPKATVADGSGLCTGHVLRCVPGEPARTTPRPRRRRCLHGATTAFAPVQTSSQTCRSKPMPPLSRGSWTCGVFTSHQHSTPCC